MPATMTYPFSRPMYTMYVAKGGRRRPGLISRLATPPGSQVGPCRPALKSAPWGENCQDHRHVGADRGLT